MFLCICNSVLSLPPGNWKLIWNDEFNNTVLNDSWWNVGTLYAPNGDIVPGAYGGHQLNWQYLGYIMKDDVLLENGILRLRNQQRKINGTDPKGNFNFTSGWIQSMHKVFYTYGYAEARIRYPLGTKVWPAFWTIEERLVWGAEFDIAEYYGTPWAKACKESENKTLSSPDTSIQHIPLNDCCIRCGGQTSCKAAVWTDDGNCHYKGAISGEHSGDGTLLVPGPGGLGQHLHTGDYPKSNWYDSWNAMCMDPTDATNCDVTNWHTYGLMWAEDRFEYYIDDKLRHSVLKSKVDSYPADDMYFVLNNGVLFNPDPKDTPWPNYADFDYVRLYKDQEYKKKATKQTPKNTRSGPSHFCRRSKLGDCESNYDKN